MPSPVEVLNPAKVFPHHYLRYIELRDQAAIGHSAISAVPENLVYMYRLNIPSEGWDDHPDDVARYAMLNADLSTEDILPYYDLELQAYMRTRQLLGATATETTIPLEINDDPYRQFTDVAAKVAIDTDDNRKRRKHTAEHDNLQIKISGICTRGAAQDNDRFSVMTSILAHSSQGEQGGTPTTRIPGARLVTLFRFYDALDYIEAHRS